MRNLTLRDKPPPFASDDEIADCKQIQDALFDMELSATLEAIHEAWQQHSADSCAGWLTIHDVKVAVDVLLHGGDGMTLNGREDGPFLVLHGSNEEAGPTHAFGHALCQACEEGNQPGAVHDPATCARGLV